MRSLTIGIDARAAVETGAGRGRVIREFLRELSRTDSPHRYVCYARRPWDQGLDERFEWRCQSLPLARWHAWVARDSRNLCHVFAATDSYLSVLLNRIPTVVVVYDLMAFDARTSPNRLSMVVERLTVGRAVRRARWMVCISRATQAALLERFPRARGRTSVALLAATSFVPATAEELEALPAPGFLLAVGTLEPRKNLPRLVEAYRELPRELQQAHPLVVVGAKGWRTGPTLEALRSLADRCVMLGHVSDGALAELYRRCAAFCYPSLGEGFGLPVLEAMAAGAAVVTSGASSLPEVGGEAVDYVDPEQVSSIAAGLRRVLGSEDHRSWLSAAAQARARSFSWAVFTQEMNARLETAALDPGAS